MKNVLGIKLYTMQETGDLLGVRPETVRKYIKEGRLGSRIVGGRNYITEEDLKEFLQAKQPQQ